MNIQGRMGRERERMIGMTDNERVWRAKWMKDQVLHNEPIVPEGYYKARYNIIRRFYRAPLDKLEAALVPMIGQSKALITRHLIGKFGFVLVAVYGTHYYFKYSSSNWTTKSGWKVTQSRRALYPGDPGFPHIKDTKPHEYATFGFENSPI